jgi:hypothetical protein
MTEILEYPFVKHDDLTVDERYQELQERGPNEVQLPYGEPCWLATRYEDVKAGLRQAFAGVPENELRLMLGENVIRVLGLDRAELSEVAKRIGPTIDSVIGPMPHVAPALVAHFDLRGGYLKPQKATRSYRSSARWCETTSWESEPTSERTSCVSATSR